MIATGPTVIARRMSVTSAGAGPNFPSPAPAPSDPRAHLHAEYSPGTPSDYAGSRLAATLGRFRRQWPDISYNVSSAPVDDMLRDLKQGELDLVLALFTEEPTIAARHLWRQETVWVHSDATKLDSGG